MKTSNIKQIFHFQFNNHKKGSFAADFRLNYFSKCTNRVEEIKTKLGVAGIREHA